MLSSEQIQFFEANGYLHLPQIVAPETIGAWRHEASALSASDPEPPVRVWHERALFRRAAFREVLDIAPLVEAQLALLGPDAQLLALDLLVTRPGRGGLHWHRDVQFWCDKTLSINSALYLQDMTPATGLFRVVPGSHRRDEAPQGDEPDGMIEVAARAGDVLLFDAAVWHSGNRNASTEERMGLFAYFGRYFVKRMDAHFTQPLPAVLTGTGDPMKRQLLGLELRDFVPSYHGDDEGYNRRGEAGIDYTP